MPMAKKVPRTKIPETWDASHHSTLKAVLTEEVRHGELVYEREFPNSLSQKERDSYFLTEIFNVKKLVIKKQEMENDISLRLRSNAPVQGMQKPVNPNSTISNWHSKPQNAANAPSTQNAVIENSVNSKLTHIINKIKNSHSLVPFYKVKSDYDLTLTFESRFESANLCLAYKVLSRIFKY